MSKLSLLSSILAFSLLFSACSDSSDEEESILSTNEYVLTALDSKQYLVKKELDGFTLNESKDKILILDLFATWCPPCQAEASHLTSLQKKYKDDLIVIGVTVEDNVKNSELQKFRNEYNAKYTLVNSNENRRLINAVASQLKLGRNFGIPLLALYKDGKLINYYQGAIEEEFIESDIKKALGK